ncbi:pyridine nucleotide-disulfide oxidoreductase [Rhodoferax lacus]|uniref:Pyridine nucleotide-disulfide oxidoreductase n=1 Tax=Rhodoferax lacus TaxID=2184758 RepID=A0A3E1R6F5_9BURK|nr:FAD-dependent oxidoreductase [Rhodoferax lacus]RFO94803.1 pyridine nucleotide-disulfide oxidoreductase [Rhodoferax lacus]
MLEAASPSTSKHRLVDFLLLGGGLASASAAETLRAEGAHGSILLLSTENVLPYHRPPLDKKAFMSGGVTAEKITVLRAERYRELGIEYLLGTTALRVDTTRKIVQTDKAGAIGYGKLLIATGAAALRPRIPGADAQGIFCLHTLDDAQAVRQAAQSARNVVVVGGSFIGLEIASTLRQQGASVTVIEQCDSVFPVLESAEISAFFLQLCREKGVQVLLSETVSAFLTAAGRITQVELHSGALLPCDLVILGQGVTPNTAFLAGSGLKELDGLVVNQHLQTEDPHIFAAGDVANFPDHVSGERRRWEHWDNAIKQGRLAAKNMLGQRLTYDQVSYFSSGLFGVTFEFFGTVHASNEHIVRGSLAQRSMALLYMQGDVIRGLFSTGRPAKETKSIASLIRYGVNVKAIKSRLGDPDFGLEAFPNQTVLILQGGGALGAFECGAVRALEESGIRPDIVAGVSIGALNGAIMAANATRMAAALEAFWNELALDIYGISPGPMGDLLTAWHILNFGIPNFFVPHWMSPVALGPQAWTSFYDPAPMRRLLLKYVDFSGLRASPVRLLISAVNVETGEMEVFDSYSDMLTPDHILASCSLPPGFGWTTIDGRHYWDGGIVSNSPLDMVVQRCGADGKRTFVIDLFPNKRALPKNLLEVQARRDEIGYSERLVNDVRTRELVHDFHRLVEELMGSLETDACERIKESPLYIQLMGETASLPIMRIVREARNDESASRDYDFSQAAVQRNLHDGYTLTKRMLSTVSRKERA